MFSRTINCKLFDDDWGEAWIQKEIMSNAIWSNKRNTNVEGVGIKVALLE